MKKFKAYLKRIINLIRLEEMNILPGHLAFNIIIMIVPIFSVIGVLGSNIGINQIMALLSNNVPDAVMTFLKSALEIKSGSFNLFLFIIFSLWMASGGCRAIISASDMLYKIKVKNEVRNLIKSFLMVIILFLLIGFIVIVPVLGDMIIKFLASIINEKIMLVITNLYHLLKYPLSIILMFILIKTLYIISPSIQINHRFMNNGAWFTTISWFLATRIYSFHLNNYSNYNLYYGSLSNILILFVWVYLLAYLFTIGLALNADNYMISSKNNKELLKKDA